MSHSHFAIFASEHCDFAPNPARIVKDRLSLLLRLLDIYTDRRLAYLDTFLLCVVVLMKYRASVL